MHSTLKTIVTGAAALLIALEGSFANRVESEPGEIVTCYIRQYERPSRFSYDIGFAITVPKGRKTPEIACRFPHIAFEGGENSPFEQQVKRGFFKAEVVGESKNKCKCTDKDGKMYIPPIVMDSKKATLDKKCEPLTCWNVYEHAMRKDAQKKVRDKGYVLRLSDQSLYKSDANDAMKPRLPTQEEMVIWEGDEQARIEIEKAEKQIKKPESIELPQKPEESYSSDEAALDGPNKPAGGPPSSSGSPSKTANGPSKTVDGPSSSSTSATCDEAITNISRLKVRYQNYLNNVELKLETDPEEVLEQMGKLLGFSPKAVKKN